MNIQGILHPVLELLPRKVKKLKDYAPQNKYQKIKNFFKR
jgi:hypothetical protein